MAVDHELEETLAVGLYERGAVRYAENEEDFWTLKSGRKSPVYVNLRGISSFSRDSHLNSSDQAEIRDAVVAAYGEMLDQSGTFDHILGIPHAMTCLSGLVAQHGNASVLSMRTDKKDYGSHKQIEGDYNPGEVVIALDDVITDGASKIEVVAEASKEGLLIPKILVLVDREEGGSETIAQAGLQLESALGLGGMTRTLHELGWINAQQLTWTQGYYQALVEQGLIHKIPESLTD